MTITDVGTKLTQPSEELKYRRIANPKKTAPTDKLRAQYCHWVDESKVRLPPRYDAGAALTGGNNFLIPTIRQLVVPAKRRPGKPKP